jgi:hypothetical protein
MESDGTEPTVQNYHVILLDFTLFVFNIIFRFYGELKQTRDSSVSMGAGLPSGQMRNQGFIPCRSKIFLFIYTQTGSGAHPALTKEVLEVIRQEREADPSPPSTFVVKNVRRYASTHHTSSWHSGLIN